MVIVPAYDELVKITGKVKRPMFYEMKNGESAATLLKYAGGFASMLTRRVSGCCVRTVKNFP